MNVYLRYAAKTDYLPNPFYTKAYDAHILYILFGKGEIRLGDEVKPLTPGTLCYYPPGQAYWPISSSEEPLYFVTLNFDLTQDYTHKSQLLSPVAADIYDPALAQSTQIKLPYGLFKTYFVYSDLHHLRDDITAVADIFQSVSDYRRQKAAALLQYILYQLLDIPVSKSQNVFAQALSYIETNYAIIRSNDQISDALHYHSYYINRLFLLYTGYTLHRYIMDFKLKKAAELLVQTNLSISQVADAVGFENADHFSHRFAAKYGLPPTKFRSAPQLV